MPRTLLAGAACVAVLAGAATAAPAAAPATKQVALKRIAFTPATVTIKAGQRVRWVWQDGPYVPHNVRSVGRPRFQGSSRKATGTHTVRFARRGTFRYVCTVHPGMAGKVVVR
jgi:plastocyanin